MVNGSTLVELLVVLAILGVIAGVTGITFRAEARSPRVDDAAAQATAARREALRSGKSVTVVVSGPSGVTVMTAHADGSVVADSALRVDRLTGRATR